MTPKIIHHKDFPLNQYIQDIDPKSQVYLHHTVSGVGVTGDIDWWKKTAHRIATPVIIAHSGDIHTLFDSKYWAHHLGVKNEVLKQFGISYYKDYKQKLTWNQWLNRISLGLELDSAGGLIYRDGEFHTDFRTTVKKENVIEYDHAIRGYQFYEKYTNKALDSMAYTLEHWNKEYGIPIHYNPDMWELSGKALKGEPGVWSHVSVRPDKSDCHPQPELIATLKSL